MPIVPPSIDGTLTELSNAVSARDLKPGGLFRVLVNGAVIQNFNITTNIQVFGLGATPFRRGDLVTVTQQVGSETSPPSAQVTVGGVRTALPSPNLDPRFYVCGAAVLVTALVPGCDVASSCMAARRHRRSETTWVTAPVAAPSGGRTLTCPPAMRTSTKSRTFVRATFESVRDLQFRLRQV